MNLIVLLIVLLLVLSVAGLPQWGLGWHQYGYAPSGLFGLILLILLIALLLGYRF